MPYAIWQFEHSIRCPGDFPCSISPFKNPIINSLLWMPQRRAFSIKSSKPESLPHDLHVVRSTVTAVALTRGRTIVENVRTSFLYLIYHLMSFILRRSYSPPCWAWIGQIYSKTPKRRSYYRARYSPSHPSISSICLYSSSVICQ